VFSDPEARNGEIDEYVPKQATTMRRRDFLHFSVMAATLGGRLASGFNTTIELLLKVSDSDTPLFPYRGREHGWWGYIDAAGRVVIPADDSHIGGRLFDFYAGLGAVRFDDGSDWMIDAKGSKQFAIYPNSYDWNYVMRDGLMPNRDRDSGKWGYVDRSGRWVIAPHFDLVFPFSQERGIVTIGQLRGVIDRKGKWIVSPSLPWAVGYQDGFLCIQQKKRFAYLDVDGRLAFSRDFEHATQFRNGHAAVREAGQTGVIDSTGTLVIPFQYEAILLGSDSSSPMLVKQNGVWAIVSEGKIVPLPASEITEPFSCGRAIVRDDFNGNFHFIGSDGAKLFATSYWRPEPFILDRAAVQLAPGGEHAWIDRDGKMIFRWNA
jgi:hypothetical protein